MPPKKLREPDWQDVKGDMADPSFYKLYERALSRAAGSSEQQQQQPSRVGAAALSRAACADDAVDLIEHGITKAVLKEYYGVLQERQAIKAKHWFQQTHYAKTHGKGIEHAPVKEPASRQMPRIDLPETVIDETHLPSDTTLKLVRQRAAELFAANHLLFLDVSDDKPVRRPEEHQYLTRDFRDDLHLYEANLARGLTVAGRTEYAQMKKAQGKRSEHTDYERIWIDGNKAFDGTALVAASMFVELLAAHQVKAPPFAPDSQHGRAGEDSDVEMDDGDRMRTRRPRRRAKEAGLDKIRRYAPAPTPAPATASAPGEAPVPVKRKRGRPPKVRVPSPVKPRVDQTRKQLADMRIRETNEAAAVAAAASSANVQTEFESGVAGDDEEEDEDDSDDS